MVLLGIILVSFQGKRGLAQAILVLTSPANHLLTTFLGFILYVNNTGNYV